MKFDKNHPKFTAYALGELSKKEQKLAKDYIAKHPELREQLDEVRELGGALLKELKNEPTLKLSSRRKDIIAKQAIAAQSKFYHSPRFMAGAGFLLILLISIALFWESDKKDFAYIATHKSQQVRVEAKASKTPSRNNDGLHEIVKQQPKTPIEVKKSRRPTLYPGTSSVNLSQLGLGAGKVLSKTGPGAIKSNFDPSTDRAGSSAGKNRPSGVNLSKLGLGASAVKRSYKYGGSHFSSGYGSLSGAAAGSGDLGNNKRSLNNFGRSTGATTSAGFNHRHPARARIPEADPRVSGGLTKQEIMRVIRTNLYQIRHCYERLLQRSPKARGKITTSFVVGLSGRVDSVAVRNSSISDSQMRGCVTTKVRRWSFPKPRAEKKVDVIYPFLFAPF